MKKSSLFIFLLTALAVSLKSEAALTLTINTFNSTTLSFTISGTLDEATAGAGTKGIFTVAADEFVATQFYTGSPTLVLSNITIGGSAASIGMVANGGNTGYSAAFSRNSGESVPAGTAVSGTATFSGNFTSQPTLTLWSGYDGLRDLNRIEAIGVVPEPSVALLGATFALTFLRRRR